MAPEAVYDYCGDFSAVTPTGKMRYHGIGSPKIGSRVESLVLVRSQKPRHSKHKKFVALLRSLFSGGLPGFSPCRWLALPSPHIQTIPLGNRVTGTLFGYRKGHVHFAVQEDPKAYPLLILEFATQTSALVKEMASGLVRIALECEKTTNRGKLFQEQIWSMFCNGRKSGYAIRRVFSEFDRQILTMVQAISMGAGVLPVDEDGREGELMYMRARFERVVGSRDSEAFYMMNPDGSGGPELSIFMLRI